MEKTNGGSSGRGWSTGKKTGKRGTLDLLALEMRGDVLALLATAVDRVLPHLIRTEKLENLGLVGHKLAITWISQRNGWEFQKTEHVAEDDEANRVVGDLQASKTAMKGHFVLQNHGEKHRNKILAVRHQREEAVHRDYLVPEGENGGFRAQRLD